MGPTSSPTLSGGQKDSGTPRTSDEKTDVGKVWSAAAAPGAKGEGIDARGWRAVWA